MNFQLMHVFFLSTAVLHSNVGVGAQLALQTAKSSVRAGACFQYWSEISGEIFSCLAQSAISAEVGHRESHGKLILKKMAQYSSKNFIFSFVIFCKI